MSPKTIPLQSSQESDRKINLIPILMGEVAKLNQIIVTGNLEQGEPGLLEDIRNIRKDISDIKGAQGDVLLIKNTILELDRRVSDIETRHKAIDEIKTSKKENFDKVTIALIIFAITQITEIFLKWNGWL